MTVTLRIPLSKVEYLALPDSQQRTLAARARVGVVFPLRWRVLPVLAAVAISAVVTNYLPWASLAHLPLGSRLMVKFALGALIAPAVIVPVGSVIHRRRNQLDREIEAGSLSIEFRRHSPELNALFVAELMVPLRLQAEMLGYLKEGYERELCTQGVERARVWLWSHVIRTGIALQWDTLVQFARILFGIAAVKRVLHRLWGG